MRYIIAYDVTDDNHRTKLANLLLDFGTRIQKSVFEAELSRTEVKKILSQSAQYIDSGDSLRLYPVCRNCLEGVEMLGRQPDAVISNLRII